MMPEWLLQLLPLIERIGIVVVSGLVGFLSARNTKALTVRDGTIKHLELLLGEARRGTAEAIAAKESVENDCDEYKERAAIDRDELAARESEIATLHERISKTDERKWRSLKVARAIRYAVEHGYRFDAEEIPVPPCCPKCGTEFTWKE